MDPDQARDRLLAERSRIQGLLDEIRMERRDDGPIDALSGDAGADTTTAATDLGIRDELNHALAEVDAALERVEAGTYGLDEVTGEPIDPARLEAEPTARTNIR